MDLKIKNKIIKILFLLVLLLLSGCKKYNDEKSTKVENEKRIAVTSVAIAQIMEKLDVEVVGIIESKSFELPQKYKYATKIGSPMNPDIEKIRALNVDYVFSPISLAPDLKPKYDMANINYGFVNLNSVQGLHRSIEDFGKILGKEKKAKIIIDDYNNFIKNYKQKNGNKKTKKVLILMGLPGSYVVATDKSYVGSVLKLAGAENVYIDDEKQFLNINIEDMLRRNPDIIFRTSHAMPEEVKKMFEKEFKENQNWKHFEAVKNNKVYDLDYKKFGMSANFSYKEALEYLEDILYAE